jgi:predicted helicase
MIKRKKIIIQFERSKLSIICSAKVLNEGVNIPVTDSVCFVDERNSTIDIQQCCGRAIRLYEGKKMAYIIIPTFIESFDDTELSENSFGNTIRILKAMKNTDVGISDYFVLNDNQKKECKRKIIKFEHIGKVNVSTELEFDKWISTLESKMSQIVKPKDYDKQCILRIKNWIDQYKRIPSGDTKSKNKKVDKMKDEHIIAKLYNNLKNRYQSMNDELKKEMESIPGFTLKTKIDKNEFYNETNLWLSTFDTNILTDCKKILMAIIKYICENNSFPNNLRHSYGNELQTYNIDSNKFMLLISVLKKEYAVNWQEQVKIVKYCKELLKSQ